MWMLVFFDLPVKEKPQRSRAAKFRNFLKKDGYLMLQLSVYARVVRGEDGVSKHIDRLTRNLPPEGSIRVLTVTERQYSRMKLLLGEPTKNETVAPQQMVLL